MKTAYSIWQNRIAPVFDVSSSILIRETDNGKLLSENMNSLPSSSVFSKAAFIADNNVDLLVCGAVSRETTAVLNYFKIKCCPFISGDISDITAAQEQNRLMEKQFLMPGCGGRNKCRKRVNRPGDRH